MKALLATLLVRERDVRIDLDDTDLDVRLGWAFHVHLPRTSITSAAEDHRRVYGWGAHTSFHGRWLVNTSSRGLVRLTVDPPAQGRCSGLPITVRELRLSLQDPDAFLAALGNPG